MCLPVFDHPAGKIFKLLIHLHMNKFRHSALGIEWPQTHSNTIQSSIILYIQLYFNQCSIWPNENIFISSFFHFSNSKYRESAWHKIQMHRNKCICHSKISTTKYSNEYLRLRSGILALYYHWCQGVLSLPRCQSRTKSAKAKTMKTIFHLIRSIDIHFSPTNLV